MLSNCIFDVLKNNSSEEIINWSPVVICFQIVSLTYWKTTAKMPLPAAVMLWFAFKLYLWRIEKQPIHKIKPPGKCCDLLSNCIFDVLKNNYWDAMSACGVVVICFQIVSLTYWKTTRYRRDLADNKLWFAFKLYLWRIEKQLTPNKVMKISCCDLLSNCIFDVLKNNQSARLGLIGFVVICFQIVSLTYWKTTFGAKQTYATRLWFAFKLYLWRIEKQLLVESSTFVLRCDLLSNCIFDVLKNNLGSKILAKELVVICFQIVSLTYWKTTQG